MSITSVGSNDSQSLGSVILQSLMAGNASAQSTNASSGSLSDLLSLSSTSLSLAKAPAEVTQAMNDLFTTQKDVTGDVSTLKSYFKDNPAKLTTLLGALQGTGGTYGASGSLTSNSTLMAALAKAQAGGTDTSSVISALMRTQQQDPLLASIGGSNGSSDMGLMSFLG